jgi:hypothetical protein
MENIDIKESKDESYKKVKKKIKQCRIIKFDPLRKRIKIDFDGYGIDVSDVVEIKSEYVRIEYSGEIGRSNFKFRII